MGNIKIFVSHRRDMNSEVISNPIYCNVVCGSALIKNLNGKCADNIGDNISEKAPYYSEFTVQYWAWKNCKADYYGLCHYRRYLSFADKMYPEWNEQRFAAEQILTNKTVKKYGLLNVKKMEKEIKKYDVITSVTYDTKNIPNVPKFNNVYEAFAYSPALFTSPESIEKLKGIVKDFYPEYYQALLDELDSPKHRGFNCFVMRKALFFAMCEFEFGVLFKLEKELDLKNRVGNYLRELAYLGEILYGTFIRWVINQKRYKVKETQIVLFLNTNKNVVQSYTKTLLNTLKNIFIPDHKRIKSIQAEVQRQNQTIAVLNAKLDGLLGNLEKLKEQNAALFFSQPREFPADLEERKLKFWKSYPKATGDLRIVQLAQTTLLQVFKQLCDELNITFWLHGGSLVGGLRHEGFVPWDDDIDIAMLRDSYNKIKTYIKNKSKYYEIKEYYYIDLGCRSYRFRRTDMNSEIFIDIFLYDDYSLKYDVQLKDWANLCNQKLRIRSQAVALCQEMRAFPKEPTLKGFDTLKSKLDIMLNKYIDKNKSDESADFIVWGLDNNYEDQRAYAWRHGRIFKKSDIFPLKTCIFEGVEYFIPKNFGEYVFAEYGISYLDMPKNFGESIHWKQYFSQIEQIETAQKIIENGIVIG